MKRQMLRDAAIALSLSNLCYLRVWQELFGAAGYFNNLLSARSCAAAVLNVLLLGAFFWTLQALARCSQDERLLRLARWAFLLSLIIALNAMRIYVLQVPFSSISNRLGMRTSAILSLLLLLAALSVTIRWQRAAVRAGTAFLLLLFPLAPIKLGQAAWFIGSSRPSVVQAGKAHPQNTPPRRKPGQRVLWLLFDEMDQRLAFDERPASLQLPELDRFRADALYAADAYPPGDNTLPSVAALLTGRTVWHGWPASASELMVSLKEATSRDPWSGQATVFSTARELGFTTAIIGWALPYCKVLADSLTSCSSYGLVEEDYSEAAVGTVLSRQMAGLLLNIPLYVRTLRAGLTGAERRALVHAQYVCILEDAKGAATDRELDLVFVHWPVPHPPAFYDRSREEFSPERENTYLDGLALVDRTFGEIRRAMESGGTWHTTAVLVTSDHSWRQSVAFDGKRDRRVPFMLKLPGQTWGMPYDLPFNTVLTGELLLTLMRGEIRSPEAVPAWMDVHRLQ